MRKIILLTTSLAGVAGMTAYADSSGPDLPANVSATLAATVEMEVPASAEELRDPFGVALAVLNGEAAPDDTSPDRLPALVDCFQQEKHGSVPSAALACGKVSSFRIGAAGSAPITVSEEGGLWIGVTAVDTHAVEIAADERIAAGIYPLIDYEGAIRGAGFDGLVLRGVPHSRAVLVNNTAETKIELVVFEAGEPEWPEAASGILNFGSSTLWMPFGEVGAVLPDSETVRGDIGILQLLGLPVLPPIQDALQ